MKKTQNDKDKFFNDTLKKVAEEKNGIEEFYEATLGTTGNWIGIEILFTPSIGIWMFISIIAI